MVKYSAKKTPPNCLRFSVRLVVKAALRQCGKEMVANYARRSVQGVGARVIEVEGRREIGAVRTLLGCETRRNGSVRFVVFGQDLTVLQFPLMT